MLSTFLNTIPSGEPEPHEKTVYYYRSGVGSPPFCFGSTPCCFSRTPSCSSLSSVESSDGVQCPCGSCQWYTVEKDKTSYLHSNHNHNNNNNSKSVPICGLNNLQLRFLCPSDLKEVQALCQDWFPIDYPLSWYKDITSEPSFYSLAALYNGVIIGLIVAEILQYTSLNKEDKDILASSFDKHIEVGYILSLGVSEDYRRNGIASLLLDNLISHLTTAENSSCKAIFLHVLTSNKPAIHFYEKRRFRLHSFLPYYYSIKGRSRDGFTYVLYINGGHAAWSLCDYVKHWCESLYRINLSSWLYGRLTGAVHWLILVTTLGDQFAFTITRNKGSNFTKNSR
ncbi:hypothetical protein M8J75_005889 [Diaphorina citri]|nr:hypothetical protein M8J75_005889 [Diaphorina citri]